MDQTIQKQENQLQILDNEKAEIEIDLLEIFYHLLDHWKLILICFLAGTILMAGCTVFLMEPQYEAVSKMYVLSSSDSVVNLSDLQLGTYLASDYQEVFSTHEVTESVISNLNLPYTYNQLQDMLSISNPSGTRILHIKITSPSPEEAAAISNEFLEVASQYVANVMVTDRPTVLSTALVPKNPVSPSLSKNMVLGAMAGTLIACAYLVITFMLDDKVKSGEDIAKITGLPVLAEIPLFTMKNAQAQSESKLKNLVAHKPAQERSDAQ